MNNPRKCGQLALTVATLLIQIMVVPAAAAAAWTSTGSLKTASSFHTATLLPNGKVLLAGGLVAGADTTNRTEMYDPAEESWSNSGPMTTNRSVHTATLLPNGKVLVAGGFAAANGGSPLASAELYDPASGTWARTGSMATPRGYHVAILLANGKLLVAGGGSNNFSIVSSTEVYDPSTGVWTPTGRMTNPRAGFVGTGLSNGKVLVAGGQVVRDNTIASAELYDPATGIWTPTGSMTYDRSDFTATLLTNGKVLAAGGWGSTSDHFASTELYDPANRQWAAGGPLNTGRFYHSATLLQNGAVLVAGGFDTADTFAGAELCDPSSGSWRNTATLNLGRRLHTATLLLSGKVLVAGGQDNSGFLSSAELYDSGPSASLLPGLYLTNAAVLPGGYAQIEAVAPTNGVYCLLLSTNLADWESVAPFDGLNGPGAPTNRFVLNSYPTTVGQIGPVFYLRLMVGLMPHYNFKLCFQDFAGPLTNGLATVAFPQQVSDYWAFFSVDQALSFPQPSNIFFTGPPRSGLTNAPTGGYRIEPTNHTAWFTSLAQTDPPYPPPGTWTVNYGGANLHFTLPDAQVASRLVVAQPTMVVSNGYLSSLSWVYREPVAGQRLSATPAFVSKVFIEVWGGTPYDRLYDSNDLPAATTNHTLSSPVLWSDVVSVNISYVDDLGNDYFITYGP